MLYNFISLYTTNVGLVMGSSDTANDGGGGCVHDSGGAGRVTVMMTIESTTTK